MGIRGNEPQIEAEGQGPTRAAEDPAVKREFERLLTPLLDSLYGAAVRMTRNASDAEDLVQDTVVKAFRFFHRFERGTNFKAWILRVMTNLFINQYRKAERQGEQVDLDDLEDVWIYAKMWDAVGSGPGRDPAQVVLTKIGEAMIRDAIDALPTEFRVVVTLVDVEQFSYEEVAESMEIPVGTVKSRLYRGRKQLQRRLWDYLQEELSA